MLKSIQKFTNTNYQGQKKIDPSIRINNQKEIYEGYGLQMAKEQSSRCLSCSYAGCESPGGCPLGNNIPTWLSLAAEDRLEEAYEVSLLTNFFGGITSRLCPKDRLCQNKETGCTLEVSGHDTVAIGAVEQFISDTAFEKEFVKNFKPKKELNLSCGIIGSGPAGLAAAEKLRRYGYKVTLYDRNKKPGGLLSYGIVDFKIEKEVVAKYIKVFEDSGVKFVQNCEVGKDVQFSELRKKHDAILIAAGVYKSRELSDIEGTNLKGIVNAIDFLIASNKINAGEKDEGYESGLLNAKDKHVVIIGGGDTSSDSNRLAIRQGAKSVTCIYRRTKENMPGSPTEVKNAEEEGVVYKWLSSPKKFIGKDKVEAVVVNKMRLGPPGEDGRQKPVNIEGEEETIKADLVVKALGFDPEDFKKMFDNNLELNNPAKTIKIELEKQNFKTNLEGVFASGDCAVGAALVVTSIRDSMAAAKSIIKYLDEKRLKKKVA